LLWRNKNYIDQKEELCYGEIRIILTKKGSFATAKEELYRPKRGALLQQNKSYIDQKGELCYGETRIILTKKGSFATAKQELY